ncbi:MAG TPA: glutamate-1-semialdehyde 2,1-aminomutase [Blastocatellia bacterium]|nr:glutamate-1-semialdehyde 2,1-aminomutase [Blastocatellia bacterium]
MKTKSEQLFERAQRSIPGGVNSPVRAFRGVGGTPVFMKSAQGAFLHDADGRELIDYIGSWGPMILGHAHPGVVEALRDALEHGTSYGAPTELEIQLAEAICARVPSMELVRLTSSGTEATMSAIRVARGFTGRNKLVKFEGCYHGHGDALLVRAGSGVATLGLPDSPGVTPGAAADTLIARFNDLESVERLFAEAPDEIACVIVEPVAGNMGCVPPEDGFLAGLRRVTEQHGAVLIFDEVMTGFRVANGGAQALYGITPDMTCLGKIIGGGLPVGAFGGRREIMERVAPLGPVYQAGTLSGNPLAVTAGLATLRLIDELDVYPLVERAAARLAIGLAELAAAADIPTVSNRVGSMMTMFFHDGPVVRDWQTASRSDTTRYAAFFHQMLDRGVYLAPSQYEAAFVSLAHTDDIVDRTLSAASEAFAAIRL